MAPSSQVSFQMRSVIVAYRFDLGWSYAKIAEHLSISHTTIKKLCLRTKSRCQAKEQRGNATKLQYLVLYTEDAPRGGRPKRAKPGDSLSIAVRKGLTEYEDFERPQAANQAIKKRQTLGELSPNINPLDRKQIIHIAKDPIHCQADTEQPKPLTRKRRLIKPDLNDSDIQNRLEYCDWIDDVYKRQCVLIYTDEKPYSFGGSEKGTHVTAPKGEVRYTSRKRQRFQIEQWAAGCSSDVSIRRPHLCWDIKTQELPELADKLAKVNEQLREEVELRRWNCSLENTVEWAELKRRNDEIRAANTKDSLDSLKTNRKLLTAATLYPHQSFKPTGSKGGLNFVWYAFEVLQKELFPYYKALSDHNAGKDVYIIEDNDPSHIKARKLLAAEINQDQIKFAPHPASSPDFNLIETLQKYHNKVLEDFRTHISTASIAVKEKAKVEMKKAWQSIEMDEVWQNRGSNYALKLIANRCRQDQGGNHFRDDINTEKC